MNVQLPSIETQAIKIPTISFFEVKWNLDVAFHPHDYVNNLLLDNGGCILLDDGGVILLDN